MVVYGILESTTNTVVYVGLSRNPEGRLSRHESAARNGSHFPLHAWWRTQEATPILIELEQTSDADGLAMEAEWIRYFFDAGAALFNTVHSGKPMEEKIRTKISGSLLGHSVSEQTKEAISSTLTGRSLTEAHRRALSVANKRHPLNIVFTSEVRKKMSKAAKMRASKPIDHICAPDKPTKRSNCFTCSRCGRMVWIKPSLGESGGDYV